MKVCEALASLYLCEPLEDGVRVGTTCLLPSGAIVRLLVRAGTDQAVVTDDGLAASEIEAAGARLTSPKRVLARYATKYGIKSSDTELYMKVTVSELPAAVVLVGNAVADAVEQETAKATFPHRRDLKTALSDLIKSRMGEDAAKKKKLTGKYAQHEFAHVISAPEPQNIVVIDPVLPESSSMNSRIVAHLDVREAYRDRIHQYLVYDDAEDWTSDKLGMLRLAAPVVPFSQADMMLGRELVRH